MPMRTPLEKVADEISKYLAAFEADPKINVETFGSGLHRFYWASAGATGARIRVTYITYQGGTLLSPEDAEKYLAWLRQGWVGSHWDMERGGGKKMKVRPNPEPPNIPTIVHEDNFHVTTTHPSYGVITIARWQGSGVPLFQSPFLHRQGLHLTIHRAQLVEQKGGYSDHVHADEPLISINMTEDQWARMLSSMSVGGGVPCTLENVGRERMPYAPRHDPNEKFKREAAERGSKITESLRHLEEKIALKFEQPSVNKTERKEILKDVGNVLQEMRSNMPFFIEQFARTLEEQIAAAKTEVATYITNMAQQVGLPELGKRLMAENQSLLLEAGTSQPTLEGGSDADAAADDHVAQ